MHADDGAMSLLVEALSRAGKVEEAVQSVVEMEDWQREDKVKPGLLTYNALLRMFANHGLGGSFK